MKKHIKTSWGRCCDASLCPGSDRGCRWKESWVKSHLEAGRPGWLQALLVCAESVRWLQSMQRWQSAQTDSMSFLLFQPQQALPPFTQTLLLIQRRRSVGGGSLPGFSDSADGVIDSSSDCQVSFCSSGTKMCSSFALELCYSSRGHGGGAHGRPTAKLDLI